MARGRLSELEARFAAGARGEVTLVVSGGGGEPEAAASPEDVEEEIRRRLAAGEAPVEVARTVARERGMRRREAYALVESLRGRR
jgi:16S rRNA (cytidine1402-2'-O)-methyltransferase